jgi:hypothetical protein
MHIDLHVHTYPRSQCSDIDPAELIQEAKTIGLDGFCLTEHQVLWDEAEVEKLGNSQGIKIFRGNEITTAQGDVLVFGLDKDIQGIITAQELQKEVTAQGGFSIAAHPFRGFKTFGIGQLEMNLDHASSKKIFQYVDAIEIKNGKVSDQENSMASKVADKLQMIGTAGSDAHRVQELGTHVTTFDQDIKDITELIHALREGRFTTGSLR